jgi:hypothetical protein
LLQDIRCERLTSDFLAQRQAWIRALEPLTENDRVDEDAALPSAAATTQNSQSSDDARFRSLPTRLRQNSLLREADLKVGFEIDLATVTQLTALGYPVARCERAVRATRNAGMDEALDWLFNNADDSVEDLEAAGALSTSSAGAGAVVPQEPPRMSRAVRDLLSGIATLHRGITLSPATTNLTREVFTIFMSRKLPSDVCWLIFSYSASAHDIRAILLDRTFVATGEEYNYYGHYSTLPTLRTQADCVTAAFLRYASHFLHIRQARIAGANTAQ